MKSIAIIGAGGHAKVLVDLINKLNYYKIIGFYDDNTNSKLYNLKYLGRIIDIDASIEYFIIGIGNDRIRKKISEENKNLNWATLIHPTVILSNNITIDHGTVIFAGVIIQTDVKIGEHCILNTGCSIDHECVIGDFSSICPQATICGQVKIGNSCFIGANATIIQCIELGNDCIIGAGSVIIKNVDNFVKVVGNPGRKI
tara:strand:+ start:317 stop:916 length:600 start_codon:yes stop_codon:yes gene_type:complete